MRSLLGHLLTAAAAAVVFGLTLFGVYTNFSPITGSQTQGPGEPAIPLWQPDDEGPTAEQSGEEEEAPMPILLPTPVQSPSSEDQERPIDRWTSERMEEAASKESFGRGSNESDRGGEGDDLLRGAFGNTATRPAAGPADLPKVEPLPSENGATWIEDPAQLPPDTETSLQAPPESPTDAETHPPQALPASPTETATPEQPPLGSPTDTQPPPDLSTKTEAFPQPKTAPPDPKTFPRPPTDPSLPTLDGEL